MKTNDTGSIRPVDKVTVPAATKKSSNVGDGGSGKEDTVSVTQTAEAASQIAAAKAGQGGARTERIEQLAQQIAAGEYNPDPQAIADKIINAAVLDAKLQVLFK